MKISYDPEVDALYIRLVEGEQECRTLRLNDEIARARRVYGETLTEVRCDVGGHMHLPPTRAWCSRRFTVQLFVEGPGRERLSISIAAFDDAGRWKDGISWDDLQRLKTEAGFGGRWAVECFPPTSEVVNVSNMRHLWLIETPTAFGWRP